MLSQSLSVLSLCLILLPLSTPLHTTRVVYTFPNPTWVENLAVRSCGSILTTLLTTPDLYLINPLEAKPQATIVHSFASGSRLLGITETTPDTFEIIVSNVSLTDPQAVASNMIFRVSFASPNSPAAITHTADVPDAKLLNGLATLNPTTILAADSGNGQVWAIDTRSGAAKVVISDLLMKPTSPTGGSSTGINGLRLRGSTLYFTNTAQAVLAKVQINTDGTPQGNAVILAHAFAGTTYDDFAVRGPSGDVFLAANAANAITEVPADGGAQTVVAGNVNSTRIAEPTSAAFGRGPGDKDTLYVTTAGGLGIVSADETVGGQVVAVCLEDHRAR